MNIRMGARAVRQTGCTKQGGGVRLFEDYVENFDSVFTEEEGGGAAGVEGGRSTPRSNLPQTAPTQLIRS